MISRYVLEGLIGMGVVTFLIRLLPFLPILPRGAVVRLESRQAIFPPMLITLLVIYCLSPCRHLHFSDGLMLLGCSAYVAVVQWYRGNLFLSLGVGTAAYLFLMNR